MNMQQAVLNDVRIRSQAMEVLGSYHPFWVRQAMEIIVQRRVPPAGVNDQKEGSSLSTFITNHFLNDADLSYEWATNKAIDGLYPPQYWVRLQKLDRQ